MSYYFPSKYMRIKANEVSDAYGSDKEESEEFYKIAREYLRQFPSNGRGLNECEENAVWIAEAVVHMKSKGFSRTNAEELARVRKLTKQSEFVKFFKSSVIALDLLGNGSEVNK